MDFRPFDPAGRVEITRALLPHWQQGGRTYCVNWRTTDSLPASWLKRWHTEREAWLNEHQTSLEKLEDMPVDMRREYHERFSRRWQDHLDEGHGECLLKRGDVRGRVESALRHFDGQRYVLGDFVLMPNHVHVHVLVAPSTDEDIQKLCFSWKRFSGGEINRQLGRRGEFWQAESFDHIVRHLAALRKIQRYITENPMKARLREGGIHALPAQRLARELSGFSKWPIFSRNRSRVVATHRDRDGVGGAGGVASIFGENRPLFCGHSRNGC